ncbi:MAG: hypothetical protein ACAH20_12480 [Methylobacteriaceae bacterium]
MTKDEAAARLECLIQAGQVRVSAQIDTVLALTEAGYDTAETLEAMWREMDALTVLRQNQWALFAMSDL